MVEASSRAQVSAPASGAPPVLVLGVGNSLLSDEGAGLHVLRRLQSEGVAGNVQCLDGGTLSFVLAAALEQADQLIVVDAAELGEAPGAVRCFEGEEMDAFLGSNRKHSVHEVSLLDLMAVVRLAGHIPGRRALIAIQPGSTDWGEQPTREVAAGVMRAAAQARALIRRWRAA